MTLVPKLQLGHALYAKLRFATLTTRFSLHPSPTRSEAELPGECVPKLELGNEVRLPFRKHRRGVQRQCGGFRHAIEVNPPHGIVHQLHARLRAGACEHGRELLVAERDRRRRQLPGERQDRPVGGRQAAPIAVESEDLFVRLAEFPQPVVRLTDRVQRAVLPGDDPRDLHLLPAA